MQQFADLYDAVVQFPKPTIAACHGYTVGGGAEIAIGCDIRIGGSNLQMRFPGAELGVPVGPARLVTLCGLSAAKYLLLTSSVIKADEAFRLNLVNRLAPGAATENTAMEMAGRIAAFDPEAVGQPEAHAPQVGRHRGPLGRRRPRSGRVAAQRPRPGRLTAHTGHDLGAAAPPDGCFAYDRRPLSLRPSIDLLLDDPRVAALSGRSVLPPTGWRPGRRMRGGGQGLCGAAAGPAGGDARRRPGTRGPPGADRHRRRPLGPRPEQLAAGLPRRSQGPLLPVARHRLRVAGQPAAAPDRPADRRARLLRPGGGDPAGRRRQRDRPGRGGARA